MKLTKNWLPILGIYLIIGGLAGIVVSGGSCTCADANYWWIIIGLLIGVAVWFFHQKTSQPEPEQKPVIKRKIKRRKRK